MRRGDGRRRASPRHWLPFVFFASLLLFGLTNYGGIRSPDNEIVFRAAMSFAERGRLDLGDKLIDLDGFGLAKAHDRKLYPIFGPVESIALAPFVAIGRPIAASLPASVTPPPSFYVGEGFATAMSGAPLQDRPAHALRLVCSCFNVLIGALAVSVFFLVAHRLVGSIEAALSAAAFLAVGSLFWPYTGTYFSEVLTTFFVLLSFYLLLTLDSNVRTARSFALATASGVCLALAIGTHVTAALFLPFFSAIPWLDRPRAERGDGARLAAIHLLATLAGLLPVAMYNWSRFGNVLETGRTANPGIAEIFRYGVFTAPWRGLYGLLLGAGKGLLLYSPAVMLGLVAWRHLHRLRPTLSWLLLGAIAVRWIFIASRSDWHGGFCLGPRYLLLIVPFLLLPVAAAVDSWIRHGDRRSLRLAAIVLFLCAAQQAANCVGEVFSLLHRMRQAGEGAGIAVFQGDRFYLDWRWSPLLQVLDEARSPFLLRGVPLGNHALWAILTFVLALPIVLGARALDRLAQHEPTARDRGTAA